jgi:two-component system sensor histidine kinase KdpD
LKAVKRWIPDRKTASKDAAVTILLLICAMALSALIITITGSTKNTSEIFILCVLLVALYTNGYFWGLFASIAIVIGVNYFFTYPYFSLDFSLKGYPVTFSVMLAAAIIVSTLATGMKEKSELEKEKQRIISEKQKEQMRSNLLRAISHDLRTPLTGILGASSAIMENRDRISLETRDCLIRDIHEDAEWLLRMIENILAVTKLDKEAIKLKMTPEPVEEVVAQSVSRCQKRFPGSKFDVSVPHEFIMAPMVGPLIEQVLINLIENAVKHSGSDRPTDVTVYGTGDFVYFAVRDQGKGIPEQTICKLFSDSNIKNMNDAARGLGIGLSICKTIVEAHGGRIWCNNNPDRGVTFTFSLPMEEKHAAEREDTDR